MSFVPSSEKTIREKHGPIPIPDILTPYFKIFFSEIRPALIDPNFDVLQFWLSIKGRPMELDPFSFNFTQEVKSFNSCLRTKPSETRRMVITAAFEDFKLNDLKGETIEKRIKQMEEFLNVKRNIMQSNYDRSEISIAYLEAQQYYFFYFFS